MEQVLKRIRSASARSGTSAYPSDSSMPFMRSESCSFIWHPKVVTWKRFTGLLRVSRGARLRAGLLTVGMRRKRAPLPEIAGRQHGVVSARQLATLGFDEAAV